VCVCVIDLQPNECSDVPANAQIKQKKLFRFFFLEKKPKNPLCVCLDVYAYLCSCGIWGGGFGLFSFSALLLDLLGYCVCCKCVCSLDRSLFFPFYSQRILN
jgi:hypothetical protein